MFLVPLMFLYERTPLAFVIIIYFPYRNCDDIIKVYMTMSMTQKVGIVIFM